MEARQAGTRLQEEQVQGSQAPTRARDSQDTLLEQEERCGLTTGAVDQRVARAAEEAGQAGACRVAQQAVRPLGRAPLRGQASKQSD